MGKIMILFYVLSVVFWTCFGSQGSFLAIFVQAQPPEGQWSIVGDLSGVGVTNLT